MAWERNSRLRSRRMAQSRFNLNERAKARHGWKFEAGFYLLKVFDRLVPTVAWKRTGSSWRSAVGPRAKSRSGSTIQRAPCSSSWCRTIRSPACSVCMTGNIRRFGWWTRWRPRISGAIAQISGYWTVKSFTRIKDSIALIRNRASRLRKALWLPAASLSLSKEVVGIHVLLRCMSRE